MPGFVLLLWESVKQRYPKTRLFLQEKGPSHENPPSSGNLKDVVVDISSGFPGRGDYQSAQPLFQKWKQRGALPTIRLYVRFPKWTNSPTINPHDVAANFRAMKGFALGQRRSDCSGNGKHEKIPYAFAALTNYVHVNCLLNADSDPDALIKEFCDFMYPGAGQEVAAFYDWMEKRRKNLASKDNPYLKCYSYDDLAEPASMLEAASGKCTDAFWLDKLKAAFGDFREEARVLKLVLCHVEENTRKKKEQQEAFRQRFSQPFVFADSMTAFPLCPQEVPFAPIQDSSIQVHVENGCLIFNLTAMEEHADSLRRMGKQNNQDNIWNVDCFEIMIAPEKQEEPHIQFGINPNGAVIALRYGIGIEAKKMDDNWQASAKILQDRWTAELSVPLSLVREICPDGRGRIGIFRTRVLTRQNPALVGYYSAYSGLDCTTDKKIFHDISRYHPFIIK